jgi:hypothetical protein
MRPTCHFFVAAAPFLLLCCAKEEEHLPQKSKSTLIYMVADNNLDYYAVANVKKMEQGLPESARGSCAFYAETASGLQLRADLQLKGEAQRVRLVVNEQGKLLRE